MDANIYPRSSPANFAVSKPHASFFAAAGVVCLTHAFRFPISVQHN